MRIKAYPSRTVRPTPLPVSKFTVKLKIRVANPLSRELTYISRDSAERYVARGHARWRNHRTIVFVEDTDHRFAAEQSMAQLTRSGYDRIPKMTTDQIAGIPVIGDVTKLFTNRS